MANYDTQARSNYFRVKDPEAFTEWAEELDLEVIDQKTDAGETLYGVMTDGGGGWPDQREVWSDGEECRSEIIGLDFLKELSSHLAYDEVAVLIEIGSEDMRYLSGQAIAVKNDGRTSTINLSDIYEQDRRAFDIPGAYITMAES